jgi:hypothetical protein
VWQKSNGKVQPFNTRNIILEKPKEAFNLVGKTHLIFVRIKTFFREKSVDFAFFKISNYVHQNKVRFQIGNEQNVELNDNEYSFDTSILIIQLNEADYEKKGSSILLASKN